MNIYTLSFFYYAKNNATVTDSGEDPVITLAKQFITLTKSFVIL